MNTHLTTPKAPSSKIRHLDDDEIDEVNGGWLIGALALVACFETGFLVGVGIANYKSSGSPWYGPALP